MSRETENIKREQIRDKRKLLKNTDSQKESHISFIFLERWCSAGLNHLDKNTQKT